MRNYNFTPLKNIHDFYNEIVRSHNGSKELNGSIISNEVCQGKIELVPLDFENLAIHFNLKYKAIVTYELIYDPAENWLQFVFLRQNKGGLVSFFDILQSSNTQQGYIGKKKRTWTLQEGMELEMVVICLKISSLYPMFGMDFIMNNSFEMDTALTKNNSILTSLVDTNDCLASFFKNLSILDLKGRTVEKILLVADFTNKIVKHVLCFERKQNSDIERLKDAERVLMRNFNCPPPTLEELCKIACMNHLKFQKLFKEHYGFNFYQYYQNYRLRHAKNLIEFNHYNVTEAAISIGYKNLSYFTRHFEKFFGYKPSELKRRSVNVVNV